MSINRADNDDALTLRGRMLSMTVLRLSSPNLQRILETLDGKLEQGGDFLRRLPVVFEDVPTALDLAALVDALRSRGLMPIAVLDADDAVAKQARALGLGVIDDPRRPERPRDEPVAAAPAPAAPPRREPAKIVSRPVRGGQQIYAANADLVLLAPVSAGAEVIADGCIHAYAPLRGRVIAGAQGDDSARIFTNALEAELVSIAGCYQVSEDYPPQWRGQPLQVRMQDGQLQFLPHSAITTAA